MKVLKKSKGFPAMCVGNFLVIREILEVHIRTHTGENVAKVFDKRVPSMFIWKFTEDKVFQFEDCGKAFIRVSSSKRHKTIHTGELSYKCD